MQKVKVILLVLLLAVPVVAIAAPCTENGTSGNDIRVGSAGEDVMCMWAGNDYAHGQAGRDRVRGAGGNDSLVGGAGFDIIRGRAGNDRLFAVDGAGGDLVQGGAGNDRCYGEPKDRYRSCEQIHVGNSYPKSVVLALVRMLARSMTEGEKAQVAFVEVCLSHPTPPPICGTIGKPS